MIEAKVILDSINKGNRLTTIEVTFHRFILSEFNTHRKFSRNSASSRAIPIQRQINKIIDDPAIPLEFGSNQRGMQAGEPLSGMELDNARSIWLRAAVGATEYAYELMSLGVHKQVANRILEPFMWHTAIISSTEWDNFFNQRISPLAQPEINAIAIKMRDAINGSIPVETDNWHLPYLQDDELNLSIDTKKKISVARCARVSYLTHDGERNIDKDIELYDRLVTADPPHWSPLEHVARPISDLSDNEFRGNFDGWIQLRGLKENGCV